MTFSHSQSHLLAHSHKHLNSSHSIHDQTLYALVHSEETMPGMNCTTSVFSVPKLNLMLLLHCDKVTPHRPAATQMRHTLVGHFLYPTSELQKVDVNCYFVFLHIVPNSCIHFWKIVPRSRMETVTDFHLLTSQHGNNH